MADEDAAVRQPDELGFVQAVGDGVGARSALHFGTLASAMKEPTTAGLTEVIAGLGRLG
jgi:hypothetical protein